METIGKVRRRKLVDGKSIREIARELNLSRNTVRRILRGEIGGTPYRRALQPQPRLGAFAELLRSWIEAELALPKRQRRSAQRLFEDLQGAGYAGGYDSVRRVVQRQRRAVVPSTVFIPQSFAPGEAFQFDWSAEVAEIGGVTTALKAAHVRLCHSRKFLVQVFPRETQEMLFEAHQRALAYFGGAPRRGIYDNLKTAVDAVFVGKERRFNRRFLAMMSHYLIEPTACTPAAGWEKGQIEKQVASARDWLFTPRPKFKDLGAFNAWLELRCDEIAARRPHPEWPERTIAEVFSEDEQPALQPLPAAFDGFHERVCRVSTTSLVTFDRNRYSVDCRWAARWVTLRAYATRIVLVADSEVVAEHARLFGRDKTAFNPWHYLAALTRKPGALRNGAPFKDWQLPTAVKRVRELLLKRPGGDREMVEILLALKTHDLDTLGIACDRALATGVVSASQVLNLLARLTEPPRPEPIPTPDALRLTVLPIADLTRYDALRTRPEPTCPTPSPTNSAT